MLRVFFITWSFVLVFSSLLSAQGQGGGVWLEDGASCVGSVIYDNYAKDGFGVAGGNGVLLNSSVGRNKQLVDQTFFPKPGDIYCANGEIVDRTAYAGRAKKDAIGVVFWINGDPDCTYPLGAVVSLDGQQKLSWGDGTLSICGPVDDGYGGEIPVEQSNFLKDTASYQNTKKMEDKWQGGSTSFEAGHMCWNYKAYYQNNNPQAETKDIRWCLPVLQYLRRMVVMVLEVEETLALLRTTNPEIGCQDFDDSDENRSHYWSSDDANTSGEAGLGWIVNFNTCRIDVVAKGLKYNVRPIFIF